MSLKIVPVIALDKEQTKKKGGSKMKNRTLRALLCAVILLLPSALIAAGWEWKNPVPTGNDLHAVATVSATEAFAVGDAGTILRYDGDRWRPMFGNTNANLYDVWAASATDVFAAGYDVLNNTGVILHYDGTKWERQFSSFGISMGRVWGASATDVFSIGRTNAGHSIVFHYDSNVWTVSFIAPTYVQLTSVWGLSSAEVFAVGSTVDENGFIYKYDGSQWSESPVWTNIAIEDIWGSSSDDLYVVGGSQVGVETLQGRMIHYNGTEWLPVTIAGDWPPFLEAVWGTSASDVFTVSSGLDARGVIFHYDGAAWSEQHDIANNGFFAIQGSSASDVVAVGRRGLLAHYDGVQWEDVLKSDWYYYLSGVWGFSKSSKSDLFLVGRDDAADRGVILHYDGKDFDLQLSADHIGFGQVWGPSNKDVFATGSDEERKKGVVYHYDGHRSGWTEQYATDDGLIGMWGSSGTDVFAVGVSNPPPFVPSLGKIYHYNGTSWSLQYTQQEDGTFFNSVWGTSASNVFAVGGLFLGGGVSEGFIFHYDGSVWTEQLRVNNLTFVDIWGSSDSDIFVVGHDNFNGRGAVYHYDGSDWELQYETPAEAGEIFMLSVWGSSGSDVYATGNARGAINTLLHYDGERWSFVPGGLFSPPLFGIWGASANDVFAVGPQGTVLHYDGNSLVEPAPDQASGVTLFNAQTSSMHLSCEELAERYGTPFLFRPIDDLLSLSASVSPYGQVGTFRYRLTGVSGAVRNLTLYKLRIDGEPLPFEYAGAANTFQDRMWWITDEDGGYLRTRAVLRKNRAYFVNFAIQDDGPGGYDLSDEPGTIEDPLVLGTHRACAQMPRQRN